MSKTRSKKTTEPEKDLFDVGLPDEDGEKKAKNGKTVPSGKKNGGSGKKSKSGKASGKGSGKTAEDGKKSADDELSLAVNGAGTGKTGTAAKEDTPSEKTKNAGKAAASSSKKKSSAAKRAARKRKQREKKIFGAISACLAFFILLTVVICVQKTREYRDFKEMKTYLDTDAFYPGMTVDGRDLGGMTLSEALSDFRAAEDEKIAGIGVTFSCEGDEYYFGADDLGYTSDYRQVLLSAWRKGRDGELGKRYAEAKAGCELVTECGYSDEKLRAVTEEMASVLSVEPVDAGISEFIANKGTFVYTDEQAGRSVDPDILYLQAKGAVEDGNFVDVEYETVEPKLTKAELSGSYGVISEAITNASSSNNNRISNIKLACLAISKVCLQPGEEFSFNQAVGKRTAEAGYKKAGVFISGELGEEIGGGICQVATTLFNAAVKADLEITERNAHSRPVTYVDKGKDATVSWNIQDLKFVNTHDEPIYIVAFVTKEKRVRVMIFGKQRTDGVQISLSTYITDTLPKKENKYEYTDELPTGVTEVKSEGRKGYKVNTYKVKTDANGNVLSKEFLCYSYYPPAGAVIQVGR